MRLDLLEADIVFGYRVEQSIVGLRVDAPEARTADIGQPGAETVSKLAE
jgi:hypothetical protein